MWFVYPQTCVHFSVFNFHRLKDTGNASGMGISIFKRSQMALRKRLGKFDLQKLGIKTSVDIWVWMWHLGTWDSGGLGSAGECLDLTVMEGFSIWNNSGILGFWNKLKRKMLFFCAKEWFPCGIHHLSGEFKTRQDLELTGWEEYWEYPEWLQLVIGKKYHGGDENSCFPLRAIPRSKGKISFVGWIIPELFIPGSASPWRHPS